MNFFSLGYKKEEKTENKKHIKWEKSDSNYSVIILETFTY